MGAARNIQWKLSCYNFWLRDLTDDLKSVEEANKILDKYEGHQQENLHKSVMNIIINANREVFKEAKEMCGAPSQGCGI